MRCFLFILIGCTPGDQTFKIPEESDKIEILEAVKEVEEISEIEELTRYDISSVDTNSEIGLQIVLKMISAIPSIPDPNINIIISDNTTEVKMSSPQIAYDELIKLYPELKDQIQCWVLYKGYYIFSNDEKNEAKVTCMFFSTIYAKVDGTEFWTFGPESPTPTPEKTSSNSAHPSPRQMSFHTTSSSDQKH